MVDLYKQTSKGHDFSYTLKQNTEHMTYDEVELRHTNDKVDRKNLAFTYENFTETPFWDTLKISYSHQKITTTARTDDYCDGNDKCALAGNPLGMKYNQDNQLVGEDGNLAKYKDINTKQTIHEKLPFTKPNEKWRYNRVDWDALKKKYPGVPIYASCIEENNDPSKYCSYDVEIPKKRKYL